MKMTKSSNDKFLKMMCSALKCTPEEFAAEMNAQIATPMEGTMIGRLSSQKGSDISLCQPWHPKPGEEMDD